MQEVTDEVKHRLECMSVKYEGERSISRKYETELLANNEFNISNGNPVRVITVLLFRSYSEITHGFRPHHSLLTPGD